MIQTIGEDLCNILSCVVSDSLMHACGCVGVFCMHVRCVYVCVCVCCVCVCVCVCLCMCECVHACAHVILNKSDVSGLIA